MPKPHTQSQHPSWYPWLIWFIAASYFFCDYFARVSTGVMTSELMRAFDMSALGLGSLSAFFYYPYLGMQIPVGLLVDRFSIRRLLTVMSLITAIGCYVFSIATGFSMAAFGRFLIGFSASFAFVSALKLASMWFPAEKLGLLAGLTQALGMLGAAVGDEPVQFAVQSYGWRQTLFGMAVIFAGLSIAIYAIVRDGKQPQQSQTSWNSVRGSLKTVFTNKRSWLNAAFAGLIYAPTAAFAELWGVTYFEHVHRLTSSQAAWANALIFIGWAIGGPIVGWLSDRLGRRKPLMYFSALSGCLLFLTIIVFAPLPAWMIYSLMLLYGMTNSGLVLAYAVATEIHPRQHVGTSIAFTNMASVIIGAALQPLIGYALDVLNKAQGITGTHVFMATDFRWAVSILPMTSLLAVVVLIFLQVD